MVSFLASLQARCHCCVKITTGTAASNDGAIKVLDGTGAELKPQKTYNKGTVVYDECLGSDYKGIQITSSNSNAWGGTIHFRATASGNYSTLTCTSGCTDGDGAVGTVGVDGDGDGKGQGEKVCLNGKICEFVQKLANRRIFNHDGMGCNAWVNCRLMSPARFTVPCVMAKFVNLCKN